MFRLTLTLLLSLVKLFAFNQFIIITPWTTITTYKYNYILTYAIHIYIPSISTKRFYLILLKHLVETMSHFSQNAVIHHFI